MPETQPPVDDRHLYGRLVVAVSGGCDSMALWDLLACAGRWPLVIYHLDHGWRDDTVADADALHALAARHRAEGLPEAPRVIERAVIRSEAHGRAERYARLAACARAHGASVVVTAHHREDQAETVLGNLLRGAGLPGRAGIAPVRLLAEGIHLVRPVLAVSRADLRAHAVARGLAWHEDRTNAVPDRTRTWLRLTVLPVLEAGVPGVGEALATLAERSRTELERTDAALDAVWRGTATSLDLRPLGGIDPALRAQAWYRLSRHLGLVRSRATVEGLERLASGPVGRAWAAGGLRLVRRLHHLEWTAEQRARR